MNNPFLMMQAMQNPIQMMPEIMKDPRVRNDPRAMRAAQMIQGHDSAGLQEMAENLCREYGTTPGEVAQRVRQQFGMK